MRVSPHVLHACYHLFSANGASPQPEQIPQFRLLGRSSWRWSAIPMYRRRLKKNSIKSSMEGFPNIAILSRFHTSRQSSKKFIGTVKFSSRILYLTLNMFLFLPDGSLYYHWVGLFLVNKVLSWTSLSRQGIPHQSTSDDHYNGYDIPTNSVVVANQWWERPPLQNTRFSLVLQLCSSGQCWTMNETTRNPASSDQSAF